jgi:arylsulfatase
MTAGPPDHVGEESPASGVTRRRLLQGSGAVVAGLALAGCRDDNQAERIAGSPTTTPSTTSPTSPTQPPGPYERPNILIILADDLGHTDIGCYGSEIRTPHLDALAASGRLFTDMHNNPRCCPSRASLLTGLYPTQTGVGFMVGNQGTPAYQGHLNQSCVTLGEALGNAGYRTAISGKWHVAPSGILEDWPARRGFERSFCQMGGGDYYRPNLYEDGRPIDTPTDPDYWLTTAVTDFAVERIREYSAGPDPFFLYVGFKNPHFPLQARPDEIEPYRGAFSAGWDALRVQRWETAQDKGVISPKWALPSSTGRTIRWDDAQDKAWQASRMEVYAAQVTELDTEVGRLMSALVESGARDNTLVLFLSDNGACAELVPPTKKSHVPTVNGKPMKAGNIPGLFPGPSDTFQSYGMEWAEVSNSPFRRYKRWTEEGGISSPLIASWPARLGAGGTDHSLLHVIDVMPTLLELAQTPYPQGYAGRTLTPLEGESFAGVLTSSASTTMLERSAPCCWEHMGHRAARQGRWKVVADQPVGPFELYDMATDRTETRNLATAYPDITAQLAGIWDDWKLRTHVRTWNDHHGYRPT